MKYIDAEKLKAELDKDYQKYRNRYMETRAPYTQGLIDALDLAEQTIDSLQEEHPELPKIERAEYYYHEGVCKGFSQGSAEAQKILEEFMKRKADPVIVIKQQEQPEVDLEEFDKDVAKLWGRCAAEPNDSIACLHIETFSEVARHFYELGLNARKV